jgi:glutaredoxin
MAVDVMVYSLSTCPWCRKTKKYFDEQGVSYDFLDVDTAARDEREKAVATVREMAGSLAYPVVIINGVVAQGYQPEQFADMLQQSGWRPQP